MPTTAGRYDFANYYTGDNEYVRGFDDQIKQCISIIGKDRFSYEELKSASSISKEIFGSSSDIFSVLWQNRLIGFRDNYDPAHKAKFFSERFLDDFNLPHNKEEYIFHPILIDCLGIEPIGNIPPLSDGIQVEE